MTAPSQAAAVAMLESLAAELCIRRGVPAEPATETTDAVRVPIVWEDDSADVTPDKDNNGDSQEKDDEEEEMDDLFSSFPSLSMEESPGNYHTGLFTSKGDIESHVESLLVRPILVCGNHELTAPNTSRDPDEPLEEFFATKLSHVPTMMVENLTMSFSTLLNSRLRAYAKLLARHGITLAKTKTSKSEAGNNEDEGATSTTEGVMGIEHKLETMLELGRRLAVQHVQLQYQTTTTNNNGMIEAKEIDEDNTLLVTQPVQLTVTMTVTLPHIQGDAMDTWHFSVDTGGSLAGIFSTAGPQQGPGLALLRVAELDLDLHRLLTGMTEQAARVIASIVDMTNAVYAVPLPEHPVVEEEEGDDDDDVEVDEADDGEDDYTAQLTPTKRAAEEFVSQATKTAARSQGSRKRRRRSIADLSPEKCATIVDCVIGAVDPLTLQCGGAQAQNESPTIMV